MEKANGKRFSRGYTLVEVMVAMVITLIIMAGVYQAMVDENVNQQQNEDILDMQNNARVAMTSMIWDIRRAGFLGCGGTQAADTLVNAGSSSSYIAKLTSAYPAAGGLARDMSYNSILDQLTNDPAYTVSTANVGYLKEALGFSNDASSDHDYYAEGTDALTLVFLSDEDPVDPASPMTAGTDNVPLQKATTAFDQGDIMVATDCEYYSIFQKTNASGSSSTIAHDASTMLNGSSNNLGNNYGQGTPARVYKLNTNTYFIHYDSTEDSLDFYLNNINQPIASNIEDLQFQFLFDTDGDGSLTDETWQDGLGSYSSRQVRAIRIFLLAMSVPDYSYTDKNTYDYPNSPYYSADNPFASANGSGGSPASHAPMTYPSHGEHRHRFLATAVVVLRNAGLKQN